MALLFENRRAAGIQLGAVLRQLVAERPLVLALPRGGVPVGFEVARALGAPLDVLIVRKVGAPGHKELGIGAIVGTDTPQLVLNDSLVAQLGVPQDYIRAESARELAEIERRRSRYRGTRPPPDVRGRTVIVVDDGIATGGTMRAALRGVRAGGPGRLILAVPVAAADSLADLSGECDELVCLATPEPFYAVGAYYRDFDQTSDEEVVALLEEAAAWGGSSSRYAEGANG